VLETLESAIAANGTRHPSPKPIDAAIAAGPGAEDQLVEKLDREERVAPSESARRRSGADHQGGNVMAASLAA
jgi:hypothetical protein